MKTSKKLNNLYTNELKKNDLSKIKGGSTIGTAQPVSQDLRTHVVA